MASGNALKEWMTLCRKADEGAIAAAGSLVTIHGATSKPDEGNPSERMSIFSSFTTQPKSDQLARFLDSHSDLEQVLTSFSVFCKLKTLRLEADEDAAAGILASSPRVSSQPNRNHLSEGVSIHSQSPVKSDAVSSFAVQREFDSSDTFLQTSSDPLQKRRRSVRQPLHNHGVNGRSEKISRTRSCDLSCGRRSRQRKRFVSAVHPRIPEMGPRRCSSCDGRDLAAADDSYQLLREIIP